MTIDEILKQYQKALTTKQIQDLVEKAEQYKLLNAGNRANAQTQLRQQYRQTRRGLQNLGLAGREGKLLSGREVDAMGNLKASYDAYNKQLSDSEAAIIQQQAARQAAANARARQQQAEQQQKAIEYEQERFNQEQITDPRLEREKPTREDKEYSALVNYNPFNHSADENVNYYLKIAERNGMKGVEANRYAMSMAAEVANRKGAAAEAIQPHGLKPNQEQIQQNLPSLRFAQDYGVNLMKLKQEDPAMARTIEDDVKYWYDFIDEKSEFWNNAIRNKTKDYHSAMQMQANAYAALAKLSLAAKAPAEQRQYYLMSDAAFDTAYDAAERAYTRAETEYQIAKKDSSDEMDDVISAPKAALEKATQMKNLMDQIKANRDSNSTVNLLAYQMQIPESAKTKDKEYASTKEYVDENQIGRITVNGKNGDQSFNGRETNPSSNWSSIRNLGWSADDYAKRHDTKGSKYAALINEWSLINGRTAALFGPGQLDNIDPDAIGGTLDFIQMLFGANRADTDVNYKWFRDQCLMALRGNYDDTGSAAQKEQMDAMLTLANLMTNEERARFNALLDTMGANAADEYFDLLYKTVLPERFTGYVSDYNADYMDELPWAAKAAFSVESVLPSLTQGIPGIAHAYRTNQQDPAAARVSATGYNQAQNIRNARMQKFGKFGQFAYGTTMSMWDSYFSAAISSGIGNALEGVGVGAELAGKIGSTIGGSLLGASAYNSTYQEGLERGLTPEKARMTALGSGINEMLFESLSLDMLVEHFKKGGILKVSKNGFVNWVVNTLVQGGVEGSEEVFTDIGNNLWDKMVNGIYSEELTKIREYVSQGMTLEEAKRKVSGEFAEQLGMSFAGGFASGGVMGGGSTFLGMVQNRGFERYGAKMSADAKAEVRNFNFKDEQMQELAKQSKLTNQDYGVLAAAMLQQQFEEGRSYVQNALKDGTITKEQKELYDKYAQMAKDGKLTADVVTSEVYAQDMEKLEPVFDIMDEGELIQQGMRDLAEAQRAVRDENAKYDKQVAAIENDTTLTAEEKQQKLDAIENERGEKVVEKVRDLEKVQKKYDENVKAANGKVETKRGNLTYDFTNAKAFDEMSDRQKSAIRFAKLFADKYGMNIKVVDDSVAGERIDGEYNSKTNTITVNISGSNSVMYTVSHEVTHWLQENQSKAYNTLKGAIEKELSKTDLLVTDLPKVYQDIMGDYKTADNTVMDALVKYEQDMYKRQTGETLSKELAEDEVVARCCESFLKDRGFAQKMVAENPGTARTIAAKLRQLANDMKTLNEDALERGYEKYGDLIDSSIEKAALEQIGDIEKIARMWENALNQAAKKAAKKTKESGTTQYSLSKVAPVMPTSNAWQRTLDTDEAKRRFPTLWDVAAEESEVRNPTQIKSTVSTYRKIYDILKAEGFNGTILDASSGLGYGTRAGIEEYGYDVEDIEPYPDKSYKPKYTDYSTLNKKYDVIISNAVLNVIPQDQRDALVVKMGQMLKDGGRIFINTRSKDVDTLASNMLNTKIGNMEWFVSGTGSYQKGFTPNELQAYVQDALGDGFTVVKTNKFGAASVIVTKNGTQYSFNNKLSDVDSPIVNRIANETFPIQPPTIKGADAMQKSVPSATKNALLDVQDSMFHPSQYSRNYAPQIQQRNAEYVMSKVNDDGTVKTDKQGNPLLRYPAWAYTRTGEKIVELAKRITKLYENQTDSHGNRLLPEETILSNNIFENASYLLDAEPTTECFRQTIYRAFLKQVTDKLGRPVTEREAIIVNQACIEIGIDAPCIYCYSLLDRKAKEAYKLQYLAERDAFFKALDKEYGDDIERFRKDRAEGEQTTEVDKKTKEEHKVWTKPYMLYLSRITDPAAYKDGKYQKSMARDGNWSKADRVNLWLDVWENNYKNGSLVTAKDVRNIEADEESLKAAEGNELRTRELQDVIGWSQDASQAKVIVPYSAYTNEGSGNILSWSQDKIDKLNSEYGLRWYSHADFHPAFIVDNMQQILDASAKGLKGLMYLKPTEAAEIYAPTGMLINLSCFAQYKNGQYVVDDRLGADWATVQRLRKQYKNVGAVMVVTSDDMWMWAMTQDWVDVIIPLHLVRSGRDFVDAFGLQNYSKEQADALVGADAKKKYEAYIEAKAKEQDIELNSKNRKELEKANKSVYPSEHENDYTKYMEACKKRGLTPRFDRMRQIVEKGASYNGKKITLDDYMKCVNETRMPYTKAQPLQPKFNFAAAERAAAQLKQKGFFDYFKPSSEWNGKTMKVGDWVNQAYNDILAKKEPSKLGYGRDLAIDKNGKYIEVRSSEEARQRGVGGAHDNVQHSFNDKEYLALASKVKDGTATDADKADLRKQVDAAAKSAGYPIHAYRGGGNVHNVFDTNRGAGTTQYGRGTYFTDAKGLAKEWAAERAGEPDKGYVGEYYVGIKKMFDDTSTIEPTQEWKNVERILKGYGVDSARIKHAQNYGFEGIAKALQSVGIISKGAFDAYSWKNAEKVNKILREAGYDGIKGEFYDSYQYVIFNPAQAKSADLVTYDDSGNIIPLSERFKTDRTGEEAWKNEDIRYSMNDKDFVLKKNNGEKWYELRDAKAKLYGSSVELEGGSLLNRVRMMQNLAEMYGSVTTHATSEKEAEAFKRAGAQRVVDPFVQENENDPGTWEFTHTENKYEQDTRYDAKQKRNFANAVLKEVGTYRNFKKEDLRVMRAKLEKAFAVLHNAWHGDGDQLVAMEYADKLFDQILNRYTEMSEADADMRDAILAEVPVKRDARGREYREIEVTASQMAEIKNKYTVAEYNAALSKALGTRVVVKQTENAQTLEDVFADNPYLDATTNEGDMPTVLLDRAQETVGKRTNPYKAESAERTALKDAMMAKALTIVGVEKSAAQKVREAVKQVRAEERAKAKTKAEKNKLAEQMERGEFRAKVRREERARYERKLDKLKEVKYSKDEQVKKDLLTVAKTNYQRLVNMLANPTEASHVPVQLARQVSEICLALSDLMDADMGKKADSLYDAAKSKRGVINMDKLIDAYKQTFADKDTIEQATRENPGYDPRGSFLDMSMYDETLVQMMEGVGELLKGKTVKQMDNYELRALMYTLRGVLNTVYDANKATIKGEKRFIYKVAEKMVSELQKAKNVFGKKQNAITRFLNQYTIESLGLRRIAKLYSNSDENSEFVKLVDDLNEGAIEVERIALALRKMFDPVTTKYAKDMKTWYGKNAEWIDIGNGVKITKGMRVSLAMHLLNEQNLRNLTERGVTIPNQADYKRGDYEQAYTDGTIVKMTKEQAKKIVSEMTEAEKAYFEVAKEFFHKRAGYYINRTSLKMLGYAKAIVENYFPIQVDDAYKMIQYDAKSLAKNASVEHPGFLETRKGTANVMYLNDITAVVNRQINGISKYAGLAIPMRNWNAVMNQWMWHEDANKNWVADKGNVHTELKRQMGVAQFGKSDQGRRAMVSFVDQFVEDLAGASINNANEYVSAATIGQKLTSNYVKAVLTLNARVALSQLASVPTAAAEIPWRYIAQSFAGNVEGHLNRNASNELIDMYTPLFAMRRAGTQTEVSEIMKRKGLSDKAEQKLPWALGWITFMDTLATRRLWYACERWVKGETNIPVGSDAFYKEVAKRYERVIQNTQPNFTVLQRSPALRSKNAAARIITMFGTQRMQNGGILIESAAEVAQAKDAVTRKAALKKFGRALSGQITAAIVLGISRAIVSAMRGRMKPLQDEDKEITAKSVDKYIRGEVATSLAGSFMYVGEIYDFVHGFVSGITEGDSGYDQSFALPAAEALSTLIGFFRDKDWQYFKYMHGDHTDHEKWLKTKSFINELMTVASYATGLPLANASKTLLNGLHPFGHDIADAIKTGEFLPWLRQSGRLDKKKTNANYNEWTNLGFKGSEYLYWEKKLSEYGKRDERIPILMASDLTDEQKALMLRMMDNAEATSEGTKVYKKNGDLLIDFANPTDKQQTLPMPEPKQSIDEQMDAIAAAPTAEPTATPNPLSEAKQEGVKQAVAQGVPEQTASDAFLTYQNIGQVEGRDEEFREWLFKNVSDPHQRAVLDYQVIGRAAKVEGAVTYKDNGTVYRDYTNEYWYKLSNRKAASDGTNKRYDAAKELEQTGLTVDKTVAIFDKLDELSKKAEWTEYLKAQGLTEEQIHLFLWSRGWYKR